MTSPSAIDITAKVKFRDPDGESLPLIECACGRAADVWDWILGIYPEYASECPGCHRKLYFRNDVRVYEVVT